MRRRDNSQSQAGLGLDRVESILSSQVSLFKNERKRLKNSSTLQNSISKIKSVRKLSNLRNSETFLPMTKVSDQSLWKKSTSALTQLKLSEKFNV